MSRGRVLAALILSALLVVVSHPFAVPGFDLLADAPNGALAWIALVPWWLTVRDATPEAVFRQTWLFATLFFLGTLFWLVTAMHGFGGVPMPIAVVALFLLCAFLGALHAGGAWLAASSHLPRAALMPLAWAGAEWVRSIVLTGFPWANLGYTQWRFPLLLQIADLGGVHLIAALIVLVNVAIAESLAAHRRARPLAIAAVAALALTAAYGFPRARAVDRDRGGRSVVKVALLQGDVTQDRKNDPAHDGAVRALYARMQRDAELTGPDIVVWPEAAIPGGIHVRTTVLEPKVLPEPNAAWLLAGTATGWHEGEALLAHNTAVLVAPGRRVAGLYHKTHLVPFGEYVPLRRALWFVRKLTRGAGSFLPGTSHAPLAFPGGSFGVLICYEDIFPAVARHTVEEGADFLVNITNDAWYGHSSAPYQHLGFAVLRAVETRRALVRAAQTGVSASVDSTGRVVARTRIFEGPSILQATPARGGPGSLYLDVGDCFAAGALAAAVFAARAGTGRNRSR